MKPIEKQLDKLVQMACANMRCTICGRKAECGHHIIGRANPMTRYDPVNIMALCYNCHRDVHDGKLLDWNYIDDLQKETLFALKNMSYKNFLIFVAKKTENEYLKELKEMWKELI